VFTNLPVSNIEYGESDITDHLIIKCHLILKTTSNDIDIRQMPARITIRETRRLAISDSTINKMMDEGYSIKTEAKDLYIKDVRSSKTIKQWYTPPKRM